MNTKLDGPVEPDPYMNRRAEERVAARFEVRFWGVRGSIPAPGPQTKRYGGNTPCVEVRCGDELLIFDLGSGARALGDSLLSEKSPVRGSIFISHYHYDHLQGLPFFGPIFVPTSTLTLYGSPRNGQSLPSRHASM